jgi:hypothetical protein
VMEETREITAVDKPPCGEAERPCWNPEEGRFCGCEPAPVDKPARAPKRTIKPPRTSSAVRFPDDLYDRLVAAANERDVSVNFLVSKAVEQFLDRLIPANEMRWTRD